MNDIERNQLDTFNRVRSFGLAYAAHFPTGSLGKQLFTELESLITELTLEATTQSSKMRTVRQWTQAKSAARAELLAVLKGINRTARVMAISQPDLERKFQLTRKMNDQVLLSAARAFLSDAEPLQSQFISHDRPASFLIDLGEKIVRFEQAINEQQEASSRQVTARAAIQQASKSGMELMQKLDRVIKNKFPQEEVVLAGWRKARHIVRRQRHMQPGAPASTPPQPEPMSV